MDKEILRKVCFILNTKSFECQQELLYDIDRLIKTHESKSNLNKFISEVNTKLVESSFSNDFLKDIFELTSDEISHIFLCYFKYKQNL